MVGVDPAFVCGGGTADAGSTEVGSICRDEGGRKGGWEGGREGEREGGREGGRVGGWIRHSCNATL